jgi:hypothetical protein
VIRKKKNCNHCNEENYVYKRVEGKAICQKCYFLHYNKPKPIKTRSSKQKEIDTEYQKLRNKYLEEHKFCKIALPGCQTYSSEIHHIEYRGEKTNDISTWIAGCRKCHNFLHSNPKIAKELNMLKGIK